MALHKPRLPPTWDCSCCLETYIDYAAVHVDGMKYCAPCLNSLFLRALKHEIDYPARMTIVLHPYDFGHIVTPKFIEAYIHREKEYKCPVANRVYCKHELSKPTEAGASTGSACGAFLGAQTSKDTSNALSVSVCGHCDEYTCMRCRSPLQDLASVVTHIPECESLASKSQVAAAEDVATAFESLERGRHWQRCPSCERRVELGEACNHMTCAYCEAEFCFVCGDKYTGGSGHWNEGGDGCPMYNLPGDQNAEFMPDNVEHAQHVADHAQHIADRANADDLHAQDVLDQAVAVHAQAVIDHADALHAQRNAAAELADAWAAEFPDGWPRIPMPPPLLQDDEDDDEDEVYRRTEVEEYYSDTASTASSRPGSPSECSYFSDEESERAPSPELSRDEVVWADALQWED